MRIYLGVLPTFLLFGCTLPFRNLEKVSNRIPSSKPFERWAVEIQTRQDFAAENHYISARRQAAGENGHQTIGLAFSGGGLRSATINLGVLQELENRGELAKVDYLSGVSGGAYIASWFVTHLTKEAGQSGDLTGVRDGYTSDRRALLGLDGSPAVDRLMDKRGFVFGKWNWQIVPIAGLLGATIPVNAVFDVGLHFKPTRGKFNWHHPSHYYDFCLRNTYLECPESLLPGQEINHEFLGSNRHEVRLNELNPMGSAAPYLIINSALSNVRPGKWSAETLPFEFTRYSCGAQALGYIPADHFGYPVEGTYKSGTKRVSVMRSNPAWFLPSTKPLRVSTAVAASGAAVDSAGFGRQVPTQEYQTGKDFNAPIVSTSKIGIDTLLKPLNLNLRHQNRNFAMAITRKEKSDPDKERRQILNWRQPEHDVADRGREVTLDRFAANVYSNGLYLSDGAHYENLGIFALVQRPGIKEIWSIDAGQDNDYGFVDIKHTQKVLEYAGWKVAWEEEEEPWNTDYKSCTPSGSVPEWKRSPVFKARLKRAGRMVTLYYVKSSYRQGDGADQSAKEFLTAFRYGKPGALFGKHDNFPHTSTMNLSFQEEDFTAYRQIGRVLAQWLVNTKK